MSTLEKTFPLFAGLVASVAAISLSGCAVGKHTVIAATGTHLGLDLSQDQTTMAPHMKFGYGRAELALVPTNRVDKKEPGSRIVDAFNKKEKSIKAEIASLDRDVSRLCEKAKDIDKDIKELEAKQNLPCPEHEFKRLSSVVSSLKAQKEALLKELDSKREDLILAKHGISPEKAAASSSSKVSPDQFNQLVDSSQVSFKGLDGTEYNQKGIPDGGAMDSAEVLMEIKVGGGAGIEADTGFANPLRQANSEVADKTKGLMLEANNSAETAAKNVSVAQQELDTQLQNHKAIDLKVESLKSDLDKVPSTEKIAELRNSRNAAATAYNNSITNANETEENRAILLKTLTKAQTDLNDAEKTLASAETTRANLNAAVLQLTQSHEELNRKSSALQQAVENNSKAAASARKASDDHKVALEQLSQSAEGDGSLASMKALNNPVKRVTSNRGSQFMFGDIYQRLAVGKIAVQQPGASLMMSRGPDGRVSENAAKVIKASEEVRLARISHYAADDSSKLLNLFIFPNGTGGAVNKVNLEKLTKWMSDNEVVNVTPIFFLNSDKFKVERTKAVKDLVK